MPPMIKETFFLMERICMKLMRWQAKDRLSQMSDSLVSSVVPKDMTVGRTSLIWPFKRSFDSVSDTICIESAIFSSVPIS